MMAFALFGGVAGPGHPQTPASGANTKSLHLRSAAMTRTQVEAINPDATA
jgi:hypothetical protein